MGTASKKNSSFDRRIGVLGTGRVARGLLSGMKGKGIPVAELIGRDADKRKALADEFGVPTSKSIEETDPELELLLIAVSDDAIEKVSKALPPMQGLLAHTSGSAPIERVRNGSAQGVFYPLQSFSKNEIPDWTRIPVCVEASNAEGRDALEDLGRALSDEVHVLEGEERRYLHLAAVIACNFTNHLYAQAYQLLKEHELPFRILRELVHHTTQRALEEDPREMQTGPAARGDTGTIEEHLKLLQEKPELRALYQELSERILKEQDGNDEL